MTTTTCLFGMVSWDTKPTQMRYVFTYSRTTFAGKVAEMFPAVNYPRLVTPISKVLRYYKSLAQASHRHEISPEVQR